jgi:hypothetical protein
MREREQPDGKPVVFVPHPYNRHPSFVRLASGVHIESVPLSLLDGQCTTCKEVEWEPKWTLLA